jgi:hypothetical protein
MMTEIRAFIKITIDRVKVCVAKRVTMIYRLPGQDAASSASSRSNEREKP